jgi:hypothetical protein
MVVDRYLYFNQITSIESGDFVGLLNLTTLSVEATLYFFSSVMHSSVARRGLSYNQIASIENSDFSGLGNLTTLYSP